MSKLLNIHTSTPLIQRIMHLKEDASPLWGNMTVEGMMYHNTKITNEILAAPPSDDQPTAKQRITKIVALYLLRHFPKGIKTSDRFLKKKEAVWDFDAERNSLVAIVNKAATYTQPICGKHPFFGPMQTKEWRIFLYKHLDHHLRQFGV